MLLRRYLLAVLILGFYASALRPLALGQSSKIVFTSDRSGTWQIYSMDMDGAHVRRLTYLPGDNVTPALSQDGRMVAFTAYRQATNRPLGDRVIYLMNVDGSHLRRLTPSRMSAEAPSFSFDGRRIAFAAWPKGVGTGQLLIHLMSLDGSTLINTGQPGSGPSFSPDDSRILFTCQANPRYVSQICIMDVDGSHLIPLTDARYESKAGRFSRDGRQIVFESNRPEDGSYPWALIFVMNADGSETHRIQDPAARGATPSFTSDGRVVFTKRQWVTLDYGNAQICVMNLDGTKEHCLTKPPGQSMF